MNLTHDDVEEIVRLLDASPFDELELETERFKLILRRSASPAGGWTQQSETRANPTVSAPAAPDRTAAAATVAAAHDGDGMLPVRAPLIGTFYRAPKPGAPPYVEVGSKVAADTVVGIVETMKLMNSVYAGVVGTVASIAAADGEFVEQHHILMRVRPKAKRRAR
jgi:acetyl-CoA carboxylase biotin carboxyl carrier protein